MILQTCKASLSLNFVNDMCIVICTFVEIVEIRVRYRDLDTIYPCISVM